MNNIYKEANEAGNPKGGLNNTICENPAYWCKSHQVWLTEEDVERKKCTCRPTFDMIGVEKCNSLTPVSEMPMYERIYGRRTEIVAPDDNGYVVQLARTHV